MTEEQPHRAKVSDVPAPSPGPERLQTALGRLRDALADAHPTSASLRGLVRDFGLPEHRIRFERAAANVCEEILRAVRARNQLGALHTYLLTNHSENMVLLGAAAEVLATLATVDDAGGILETGTSPKPDRLAPSQLLDARYEVVLWHAGGRADVLAELDAWADADEVSSAWLLHAEGGVGKTRLALEWARRRRAANWCAGFLPKLPPEGWAEDLCAWGAPLLVVIDYAESRPDLTKSLNELRAAHSLGGGTQLRVLLLARNDGDWFRALVERKDDLAIWLSTWSPRPLGSVAVNPAQRAEAFAEAAAVFSIALRRPAIALVPATFDDDRFGRVLYLHMAALAAVEGLPFDAGGLMGAILDHEERFWGHSARADDDIEVAAHLGLARQLVAAATLRGALTTRAEARELLKRFVDRALNHNDDRLVTLLHRVYHRVGENSWQPGLEPDLLGEAMILRIAAPVTIEQSVDEDWIEKVFPSDAAESLRIGFTVLGRLEVENAMAILWISRLLSSHMDERAVIAFEAAKAVGQRTAFSGLGDVLGDKLIASGTPEQAMALLACGYPKQTVSMARVIGWVTDQALHILPHGDAIENKAFRAKAFNDRSVFLMSLRQYSPAVECAKEAIVAYRDLEPQDPERFLPLLVTAVNNHAGSLLGANDRAGAYDVASEAVTLASSCCEGVVIVDAELRAMSLNNFAAAARSLGKRQEALDAFVKAAELIEGDATRNRNRSKENMAMVRNNIGALQLELGYRKSAMESLEKTVALYGGLSMDRQDSFLPDYAMALNNLAQLMKDSGRAAEAIGLAKEMVAIRRKLVGRSRNRYLGSLAGGLRTLSSAFAAAGNHSEALETARESKNFYAELVLEQPDIFQLELAKAQADLGRRLKTSGELSAAIESTVRALNILRGLVAQDRAVYLSELSVILLNLPSYYHLDNQSVEASRLAKEAVVVHQELARDGHPAHLMALAGSLSNLANIDPGGREKQLLATALDLIWPIFLEAPAVFLSNIRPILQNLAQAYRGKRLPVLIRRRMNEFRRLVGVG